MISPSEVSAVLVTKGDVPMEPVLASIAAAGIEDVVVWDNSQRETDLLCFGRYVGIAEAKNEWIYHQDDDLIAPIARLLEHVDPERDRWTIVCNNRIDEEWPLTAIGCVFHRDLADCFTDYIAAYGADDDFFRICDVVFAYRNAYRRVVLGYQDLPWQTWDNRMYKQYDHMHVRLRARERTLSLPSLVASC
jgi:hypothetical protein